MTEWIESRMPGAPRMARVRFLVVTRLPFDFLPGFQRYIGLTLWSRIYLREPFDLEGLASYDLLFHELVHVRQFQTQPLLFPLKYLWWQCTVGYQNNPAEIEARSIAAATVKLWDADHL